MSQQGCNPALCSAAPSLLCFRGILDPFWFFFLQWWKFEKQKLITEQTRARFKEDPSAHAESSVNNIHVFIDQYLSIIQGNILILAVGILSLQSIQTDSSCTILLPTALKYAMFSYFKMKIFMEESWLIF